MLVVDISHASRSIGAVVHGMVAFDPSVEIAGVILNKAGSPTGTPAEVVAARSTWLPVLGVLHRDDGIVGPLAAPRPGAGAERDEAAHALDRLADRVAERVDLERVLELARTAPDLDAEPWDPRLEVVPTSAAPTRRRDGGRPRVHVPLHRDRGAARAPPAATSSSSTRSPTRRCRRARRASTSAAASRRCTPPGCPPTPRLRADLHAAIAAGVPTVAECAGLLYLCSTVDGAPMVGALAARAAMTPRLTLSYRRADAAADSLLGRAGERSPATSSTAPASSLPPERRPPGASTGSPTGSRPRPCTRRTSTPTGPAIPSSPSASRTRSTPRPRMWA